MADDYSRLAEAEILPDEKGTTGAGFLAWAAACFAAPGIGFIERVMTGNAFADRHRHTFQAAVAALGAEQKFVKSHCPWPNGKVELFDRTLRVVWAYRRGLLSDDERA